MTALQGLHPVRVVMGTVYPSPFYLVAPPESAVNL